MVPAEIGWPVRRSSSGPAISIDRRRGDRQERLHHGAEALADHLLPDLQGRQPLVSRRYRPIVPPLVPRTPWSSSTPDPTASPR